MTSTLVLSGPVGDDDEANLLDEKDEYVQRKLKETTVLARIKFHPNLTRYFSCWTEVVEADNLKPLQEGTESDDSCHPFARLSEKPGPQRVLYIQVGHEDAQGKGNCTIF